NVSLGPLGLELMEQGKSLEEIASHFKDIDEGIELRQFGLVNAKGDSYTFTGSSCLTWAGGKKGEHFACQGNILTGPEVIDAMVHSFEKSSSSLASRLVIALEAGQEKGGDSRGKQSAALIVEQKGQGRAGYGDRKIDLRVEDHPTPIQELKRLLVIQEIEAFTAALETDKELDTDQAIQHLEKLIAGQKERPFDEGWIALAVLHFNNDDLEKARLCLETCLEINPLMKNILSYYPSLGIGFDDQFIQEYLD
ncbi:MAG: DUF1028 domain-containing protein, partial [Candidatus Heimdallarchaeota archaeon]